MGEVGQGRHHHPSGSRSEHHTVTLPSAIAILDRDEEHILMSHRHRFVLDVWGWELPGGLLVPEETPERTVVREALEETGHRVGSVGHVATFEPMIGMVRSPHHVFVGHGAELVAEPTEFDEGVYEWVLLSKVRSLMGGGEGAELGHSHCPTPPPCPLTGPRSQQPGQARSGPLVAEYLERYREEVESLDVLFRCPGPLMGP